MLIRDAELWGKGRADLRIAEGRIAAIGALAPLPDEPVIEARGGALLPGLHDHHIHLAAHAVARASLPCGPLAVTSEADLAAALAQPGEGWLRGIGYHESVAGLPDALTIDRWQAERPVRIQHRSGRMWLLNSRALGLLLALDAPPPGLERIDGRWTGRLFDEDGWLRRVLGGTPPALDAVGTELARHGVTGVTDMSPGNDGSSLRYFAAERAAAPTSTSASPSCAPRMIRGERSPAIVRPRPNWSSPSPRWHRPARGRATGSNMPASPPMRCWSRWSSLACRW